MWIGISAWGLLKSLVHRNQSASHCLSRARFDLNQRTCESSPGYIPCATCAHTICRGGSVLVKLSTLALQFSHLNVHRSRRTTHDSKVESVVDTPHSCDNLRDTENAHHQALCCVPVPVGMKPVEVTTKIRPQVPVRTYNGREGASGRKNAIHSKGHALTRLV